MQRAYDDDQTRTNPPQVRSRLIIEIVPELRRRIEVAAAKNDLSVQEYVQHILDQAVPPEPDSTERQRRPLSRAAVDKLLQFREELMRAHPGLVFEDSVETLRQIREERMQQLEENS